MKQIWVIVVIAFAIAAFSQQQATPPPASTPPAFPAPDKDAGRQMPPDTAAKAPSSAEVQQQIEDKIQTEPGLAATKVKVKVTSRAVMLTGNVADDAQRQAARRIAESYAGPRKIVDQVQVKEK